MTPGSGSNNLQRSRKRFASAMGVSQRASHFSNLSAGNGTFLCQAQSERQPTSAIPLFMPRCDRIPVMLTRLQQLTN